MSKYNDILIFCVHRSAQHTLNYSLTVLVEVWWTRIHVYGCGGAYYMICSVYIWFKRDLSRALNDNDIYGFRLGTIYYNPYHIGYSLCMSYPWFHSWFVATCFFLRVWSDATESQLHIYYNIAELCTYQYFIILYSSFLYYRGF